MTAMSDYRTVYIPQAMPPKVKAKEIVPERSYHLQAKLDNAAVMARDRTGGKNHTDPANTLARHLEWLSAVPDGQFNRHAARGCWDIAEAAADNRIDALERAGLLKRVATKPLKWERV